MRYLVMISFCLLAFGALAQGAPKPPKTQPSSPAKARQEAFFRKNLVDAYEKVGRRNPKWDADARAMLKLAVHRWVNTPLVTEASINRDLDWQIAYLADRAIAAGCDDPLVLYHDLLAHMTVGGRLLPQVTKTINQNMPDSKYAPFLKVLAMGNLALISTDGIGGFQERRPPAAVRKMMKCVYANLPAMVAERDLSPIYTSKICRNLTSLYFDWIEGRSPKNGEFHVYDRKPMIDKLYNILAKAAPKSPTPDIFKGIAYIGYAWDARGGGFANTVTNEGWRLMQQRLKVAKDALLSALRTDPHCAVASAEMIHVLLGASEGRKVMEHYFQRAIADDPDCFLAYNNKLYYLTPKWHGSVEDLLEFEKTCLATRRWESRIPFLVLQTQREIVDHPTTFLINPNETRALIKLHKNVPAAWHDLQALYEGYLAYNPKSVWDRNEYAWFAARGGHVEIARKHIEHLKQAAANPMFKGLAGPDLDVWSHALLSPHKQIVDWLNANTVWGPQSEFVKEQSSWVEKHLGALKDFSVVYTPNFLKSKKCILLEVRSGQVFTFQYSEQFAKQLGLKPFQLCQRVFDSTDTRSIPLEAKLIEVTLDGKPPYDITKKLTGEMIFSIPKPLPDNDLRYVAQLQFMANGPRFNTTGIPCMYDYFGSGRQEKLIPAPGKRKHRFSFDLSGSGQRTGPLVLYFSLARNNRNIISNTIGIMVDMKASPAPVKPIPPKPPMGN